MASFRSQAKKFMTNTESTRKVKSIKADVDAMKRQSVLDESIQQFFDNGYEATSLESIADALGVTKQFIYSRFNSKSEILVSICRSGAKAAEKAVELSEEIEGNAAVRLACILRFFVQLQIEHRREVAIYFREFKNLPADEAHAIDASKLRFHRMLCAVLNEGKAAGLFEFDDTSLAASALGGMVSWPFFWFQPEGRWVPTLVAHQFAALALKTVGVSDPSIVAAG